MEQVKTHNKLLALVMTMVMALALSMALAPSAFAVDWNNNVTVTAIAGNGTYVIDDNYEANITECTTNADGTDNATAQVPKTEAGQYIKVTMQFSDGASLDDLDADEAREYLQNNVSIAGRSIASANYSRPVFNVSVDADARKIVFYIGSVAGGYTTANYNGKLYIAASDDNDVIEEAMGADVETLIDNGVKITETPILTDNNTKATFQLTHAAYHRGMVHVLIMAGDLPIYNGTGTFSNGGLTIHAHTFATQTTSSFADAIATAAAALTSPYGYTISADGDTITVYCGGASVANVTAHIYDCGYLNNIHGAVGDITEPEIQND